jgi:molybdenum cofactor biosynthesis protein B
VTARARRGVRARVGPARRSALPRRRPAHAAPHAVGCAIVTVSDTRGPREDRSGDELERRLEQGGHRVVDRAWVADEVAAIRRKVRAALARKDVDAVLVTGGTGVAPRDVTPEAVAPLVGRWLPGFGEQFRALSFEQVGSAAWLSRAAAGIANGRLLVILPGSPAAVRLAADRLLVPELAHAARLLGRLEKKE